MKTKTIIEEITHEDLVNLLSTATYGSNWLGVDKVWEDYYGTELEDDNDCAEDTFAKVLLDGKFLIVSDFYAEDESEFYGDLPHLWNAYDECMEYRVTLDDIKRGLAKALDNGGWDAECVFNLASESGNFDIVEAEELMQVIVFGEAIYG